MTAVQDLDLCVCICTEKYSARERKRRIPPINKTIESIEIRLIIELIKLPPPPCSLNRPIRPIH